MRVAFQMEDMADTVNGETHGLLITEEACRRGHEVFHYNPETISMDTDDITAQVASVHVDLSKDEYFQLGERREMSLADFDMIWFRQDPPFDMAYVTNTFILDFLKDKGVLVSNNPYWIRNMPDKLCIFEYAEHMCPTLVSRDLKRIQEFIDQYKDVIIKPLYSFHGNGIARTDNVKDAEVELSKCVEPLMFQPYLSEITEGNKRIVLYDGEIVGSLNTINNSEDEFRIYRDSVDVAYDPTDKEIELSKKIGVLLKERGLHFIGIDFIGEYLMEVNTGSCGSLLRLNEIYGERFEAKLWDVMERKLNEFKAP